MSSSACASKPAENKTSSGANSSSAGSHASRTASRSSRAPAPAAQRDIDHVGGGILGAAVRIERVLEGRRHQHLRSPSKMSSVPLPWCTSKSMIATRSRPCACERVARGDRDVVEDAEAHRPRAAGVVARRAHRAEAAFDLILSEPGRWRAPRRPRRAAPPAGCHGFIAVSGSRCDRAAAAARASRIARTYSTGCTRASCSSVASGASSARCRRHARGDELVLDRVEPRGRSGWPRAHVVLQAVGMRDKCRSHAACDLNATPVQSTHAAQGRIPATNTSAAARSSA